MATVVSQFENVLSQLQQQAVPVSAPLRPVPAMSKSHTVLTTQKTYKFFQEKKGIIILALLLIVAVVIWGVRAYLLKKAKMKEEESSEDAEEEFSSFFKDKKPLAAPTLAAPPGPVRAALSVQHPVQQPSQPPVQQPSQPAHPPPRPAQYMPPPSMQGPPAARAQPFDAVIKLDSASEMPLAGSTDKKMTSAESEERPGGGKRGEKESAIPGSDVGGTPKPPPGNTAPGGGPPSDPQFTAL